MAAVSIHTSRLRMSHENPARFLLIEVALAIAPWLATGPIAPTPLVVGSVIALGAVLLGEPVTWNLFAGAGVVILGVALAEGRLGMGPESGARPRRAVRPTVDAPAYPRASEPVESPVAREQPAATERSERKEAP